MHINWVEEFSEQQLREIYALYKQQWWTKGRSYNQFEIMITHSSLSMACYSNEQLLGFARVLTDKIFKAVIFDLIVGKPFQLKGIGHKIVEYILSHEMLQNVKSFELYCPDSIAPFYQKIGFIKSDSVLLQNKPGSRNFSILTSE